MTDKQRIRAEIERLANHHKKMVAKYRASGYMDAAAIESVQYMHDVNLLTFIDSMQEEPMCEDFEEETKKVQKQYKTSDEYDGYPATIYASDIAYIARHFAQWQKQRMMKDAVEACVIACDKDRPSLAFSHAAELLALKKLNAVEGDRIKIIIIKEDQQ